MRIKKFDNMKCLGIFLIVLGHMFEAVNCGRIGEYLHMIIYSFHIPLFIFIMGYFAKAKRYAWLKIFILYIVIQTIYLVAFNMKHLMTGEWIRKDYTTPFWLAWFLMLMLIYKLITPFVIKKPLKQKFMLLCCVVILALFSSKIPCIGYRFSLNRVITFFPYFVLGTIWREMNFKITKKYLLLVLVAICSVFISVQNFIDINVLYGIIGSPSQRLINYIIAFIWIIFLMAWIPNTEISRTISNVGRNTLPIFLFHGLVIKTVFTFWEPTYGAFNIVICITFSVVLCLLFAHDKLTKVLSLQLI